MTDDNGFIRSEIKSCKGIHLGFPGCQIKRAISKVRCRTENNSALNVFIQTVCECRSKLALRSRMFDHSSKWLTVLSRGNVVSSKGDRLCNRNVCKQN